MNEKEFLEMKEILRKQREKIRGNPRYAFEILERHKLLTPSGRKKALQAIKNWERKQGVSK